MTGDKKNIHVGDAVECIAKTIDLCDNDIMNIGSGNPVSKWYEENYA